MGCLSFTTTGLEAVSGWDARAPCLACPACP